MNFLLVRHAVAVTREHWTGADEDRPLTSIGVAQAAGLAGAFAEYGVTAVVTSDRRRCWETVLPAAARLGLTVTFDARLSDPDHERAREVLAEWAGGSVAVCSRGQTIRGLLDAAEAVGVDPAAPRRPCEMGSLWIVHKGLAGDLAVVAYRPPADWSFGHARSRPMSNTS